MPVAADRMVPAVTPGTAEGIAPRIVAGGESPPSPCATTTICTVEPAGKPANEALVEVVSTACVRPAAVAVTVKDVSPDPARQETTRAPAVSTFARSWDTGAG
ncbi:MAG TPA: hypothetical protein VGO26_00390, partial [Amnibacterium sp.]|nr:hypothetical protein [Amnibacterium sp.]